MYPRNKYWLPLVKFLKKHLEEDEYFIGPEVLLYEFPMVLPYQILKDIRLEDYDIQHIVFHKKLTYDLTNDYLDFIRENNFKPVWGNHLFVVFKRNPGKIESIKAAQYILHTRINWKKYYKPEKKEKTGILITTYNRPDFLKRLLSQLQNREEEIVVVNDGSDKVFKADYEKIKKDFPQVVFLETPLNRGLVFSLNTGFSYFLSDPDVEWIHYIQDDVILKPGFFEILDQIKDKKKHPVLTGIYRKPHKIFEKTHIHDHEVFLLKSAPAQHLFLHRQYLMDNMPIPNPYLGAPKPDRGKPGQGADEDWWLLSWSPKSIVKRGGYIVCVPGLCETDGFGENSTWDPVTKE